MPVTKLLLGACLVVIASAAISFALAFLCARLGVKMGMPDRSHPRHRRIKLFLALVIAAMVAMPIFYKYSLSGEAKGRFIRWISGK